MKEIVIKGIDEVVYHDVTDEGLNIYMCVNEKVNNFYMTYSIKYGSNDTKFKVGKKVMEVPSGTAHFLEHLKFNVAEGKTATEYFNQYGLSINAFTTYEFTSYEVYGDNNFKEGLEYLIEYVSIPYFTKELVNNEKGIIIEETSMVFDNPYNKLYHETYRSLFHHNGRRNLIAGYAADVKKINLQNILDAYNSFYHPMNSFIVVTGNFNPHETVSIIKKKMSSIKYPEYSNPVKLVEKEPYAVLDRNKTIKCKVELDKAKLVYKMKVSDFKKFDKKKVLMALSIILRSNFGSTSDLKEDLYNKELVTGLFTNYSCIGDYFIVGFNIESKYTDDVIEILKDKMNNLTMDDKTIVRRARANIASMINSYDDIEYVNNNIQTELVVYDELSVNLYNEYKDLTLSDVKYVINNMSFDNYSIVKMIPNEEKPI